MLLCSHDCNDLPNPRIRGRGLGMVSAQICALGAWLVMGLLELENRVKGWDTT